MVDNVAMPRPSKPLIRRDAVLEASLRIIDTEGLDALSLPRLARELNVQAPSLANQCSATGAFAEAIRSFLRGAAPQVQETAPPPQHWGDFGSAAADFEESTAS